VLKSSFTYAPIWVINNIISRSILSQLKIPLEDLFVLSKEMFCQEE
jgi:hypothetical protein